MGLILSIDVGTTNLKAGIVDEKGELLALRRVQTPVVRPEWGAAEHDPGELYDMIISISREISARYRHDIEHVSISTYQLGLILLDEHRAPLTGMTLLSDMRARETIEEFKATYDARELYRRTGCPPMFQYPLARLFYFKKAKPEIFKKARYFLGSKDYLLMQLTGEMVTEPSIAAATQMFNVEHYDWDDYALNLIGARKYQLARVVDGMSTAIPVLGSVRKELGITTTDLDIFPSVYDGGALAVGLSGVRDGVGVMNVGTSAMVRAPSNKPIFDLTGDMRLQPYCLGEDVFLNGGALNNAALPINWLREKLPPLDLNDVPQLGEVKGPPLFCLPYLTGERDAKIGPFASGVFFGLREHHSKRDMLRSVMEGVAFSLCMIRDALITDQLTINEFRLGGGGANSKSWTQIFSDVFNTPITLPEGEEIALIGNAMIAFTASGVFDSLSEASDAMVRIGATVEPSVERARKYADYFAFFKSLRENLGSSFEQHVKLGQN